MRASDSLRLGASAPEILSALSAYAESLQDIPGLPDGFARPLRGEADVRERIAALVSTVNLTSQHRLHRDCEAAKRALRVFAAAQARLASGRGPA